MKLKDFFKTKNRHKDIILNLSTSMSELPKSKEQVFKINGDYIYIGENKYNIEDLLLNKIPLTDDLMQTLEDELQLIVYKFLYSKKKKLDLITYVNNKIKELDKLSNLVLSNRNHNVIDILNVINNSYKNIVTTKIVYSDNVILNNNDYLFYNGERTILNNKQYKINELSQNYKVEINFSRSHLSYISFNDTLKTLDTFKIYFIDGSTQVKFVKEFNLSDKLIQVEKTCTKIIIEGLGSSEITNNPIICVGKSKTNLNRGVAVIECDFSKLKIANRYHISAHDEIKIFLWKKEDVDFSLPYNEFKSKYYSLEKLVNTNESTDINLMDNYLVSFIETNISILKQIKIYGVDQ